MFLGESRHSMDVKGRCFVPKRFQEDLDRDTSGSLGCVLARGFEKCIFLFSQSTFDEMVRRLATGPFSGSEHRKMQRLFFSSSCRLALDSSGRVLVPAKLKQYAGLGKEIVMVGACDRAELWNASDWEAFESANEGEYDQLDLLLDGASRPRSEEREGGPGS